jgi:hypothetical protein
VLGPVQLRMAAVLLPGVPRGTGAAAAHISSRALGVPADQGWSLLLADPDSPGWAEGHAQLQAGA